jgi:hypothetical protein
MFRALKGKKYKTVKAISRFVEQKLMLLAPTLAVTKSIIIVAMNLATLCCAA